MIAGATFPTHFLFTKEEKMFKKIGQTAAVFLCIFSALGADAQTWPQKPIRFVVPASAGGATDFGARVVGEQLSKSLGTPILVENRAGATGAIGMAEVARSAPDGYTVLIAPDLVTTLKLTQKDAAVDIVRDFAPVTLIAIQPLVLVAHESIGVSSLQDLIKLAKAKPNTLAYSSSGMGSTHHLAGELFSKLAGISLVHVPYKGSSDAFKDLVSGQIPLGVIGSSVLVPYANDKRLRLLAVTPAVRSTTFPSTPTLAESGFKGFDVKTWLGALVHAKTDPAIVAKLNVEIRRALEMPEVKAKLASASLEVGGNTSAEFAAIIKDDVERWTKLVTESQLKLQ